MRIIPNILQQYKRFSICQHGIKRCLASRTSPIKFLVPELNQTLNKYLNSLKPLLNESEMKCTQELIEKFTSAGGEGEKLQKLLKERADKSDNWLAEWWKTIAYLDGRDPIVIHSNPGVRFPNEKFETSEDWIHFSTNFLTSLLKYKIIIDDNKIPQEYLNNDPLCMQQYYSLFSTCRIPGTKSDEIFSAGSHLLKPDHRSNYITVVHKNRFFLMEVIDRKTQRIYCKDAICRGFYKVLELARTKGQPIGLMTSENRNVWGTSYIRLQEIPINHKAFSAIHDSLLLFCLDSPVFSNNNGKDNLDSLVARNALHGNGHKGNSANRWFDKTIQVIVSSDGACGMNYEHTTAEAPPLISMIDYVYNNMRKEIGESGNVYSSEICPLHELEFSLDSKTREEIDNAKINISSLVNDLELHAKSFNDFGKSKLKALKVSPDAFIQVGIQLGYYTMYNAPGSTYESGSLRRYKLGRTDTIRTCSPEAVLFCQSMKNSNVSDSEKKTLLLSAIEKNSIYAIDVLNGQGIDRHLLGLKLIALENNLNIPDIFNDTSFKKAMHHVLSTSQGSAVVDLTMCYGPLVRDGYGFCYNPQPDKILSCISALNSSSSTNALALYSLIETAWQNMFKLLSL